MLAGAAGGITVGALGTVAASLETELLRWQAETKSTREAMADCGRVRAGRPAISASPPRRSWPRSAGRKVRAVTTSRPINRCAWPPR